MTTTDQPAPTTATEVPSLYERIGGRAGLERIVPDVVRNHLENPVIAPRFLNASKPPEELTRLAIEFFATGLSGTPSYEGLSMPAAHTGMNIGAAEYMAVLDDILAALDQHGVGPAEQAELLYIAYGMKGDIVGR
jgi:hemoglobin